MRPKNGEGSFYDGGREFRSIGDRYGGGGQWWPPTRIATVPGLPSLASVVEVEDG